MIRNNLATRPFYNVMAVRGWLAVLGAAALAAAALNVVQVLRASSASTELVTRAGGDEARAAELGRNAQRLRSSIDLSGVEALSADARQANDLIDRRTFSWTELFNRFERTLPDDVRITAVHPSVDRQRRIVLVISVLARSVDNVNEFMESLDQTGAFLDVRSSEEQTTEDGQIESTLRMIYRAPGPGDPAHAAAADLRPQQRAAQPGGTR